MGVGTWDRGSTNRCGRGRALARAALFIGIALLGASQVAPATADPPPRGTASYKWLKASCAYNQARGTMVKIGTIRTKVHGVSDPYPGADENSRYYQLVKVQIDRLAGFNGDTWRKVTLKQWDWSRFRESDLDTPTYSTSSVRTGLGNDAGTFSAKATVLLKRVVDGAPDLTLSKYKVRSQSFTCPGPDGTFPAPGGTAPSGGGGS